MGNELGAIVHAQVSGWWRALEQLLDRVDHINSSATSTYTNRQANAGLHRIAVVWLRWDEQTQVSRVNPLGSAAVVVDNKHSPSTRTRDLALGPSRFHWKSQSTTTAASSTGQRTIHQATRGSRVLLFVHEHRHEGERPMAIRRRLERAIPAGWMQGMALAV